MKLPRIMSSFRKDDLSVTLFPETPHPLNVLERLAALVFRAWLI